MLLPLALDFESRGLSSINLTSPVLLPGEDREERITGTAIYTPTAAFPAQEGYGAVSSVPVNFRIALASNPAAISHFRRNLALSLAFHKTKASLTSPRPLPRSSSSSSRHQLPSSACSPPPAPSFQPIPFHDRVLACWEDSFGAWVISRAQKPNVESLEAHWARLVAGAAPRQTDSGEQEENARNDDAGDGSSLRRYGQAVGLLVQVAEIIEALHERRVAITACRPESFHITITPFIPTSGGIVSLDTHPSVLRVELARVADCVQLPGFSWSHLSGHDPFRPLPTLGPARISSPSSRRSSEQSSQKPASVVQGSAADNIGGIYDEGVIRKHLRFLAPETISSRRVTEAGDLFSFGVAAYEIVTGQKTESTPTTPDNVDLLSHVAEHLNRTVTPPHEILASTSLDLPPLPLELSSIIMKCLSRELDDRYSSVHSLLHDLRTFQSLALNDQPLSNLNVGQVDKASRFSLPRQLVQRDCQVAALEKTFDSIAGQGEEVGPVEIDDWDGGVEFGMEVEHHPRPELRSSAASSIISGSGSASGGKVGVISVWGVSGSGKSRLVEIWAKELERREGGGAALIGWSKLDQHLRKPLSGFVQLFQSLLDRVFSDPKENARLWREKILAALSNQGRVFLNLISSDWRDVLAPEMSQPSALEAVDWENMLQGFRLWSKRVIQLFATRQRPLVLIIDDAQWLGPEELKLWRDILDSPSKPLKSILVVAIYRVEEAGVPPSLSTRLATRTTDVSVERFDADGVTSFLRQCFAWDPSDPSVPTLVEFLFAETEGSPFFLRSLVTSLVRDGVISFSFEDLRWKFDSYNLLSLKAHSSDGGVDDYLRKRLLELPEEVQVTLQTLACLPSSGFKVQDLCGLLGRPLREIEGRLLLANLFVVVNGSRVRFTHDRNLAAASSLLSPESRGKLHLKISRFLRRPDLLNDNLYDAVDNAVTARSLGFAEDDDELAVLALRAAQRAALSVMFEQSFSYLEVVESLLNLSDPATWMRLRSLCFSFSQLFAEVSGVLKKFDAVGRIRGMLVFCETPLEEVQMRTSLVRLLLSGFSYPDACQEAFIAISKAGFDPLDIAPELSALVPQRSSDVTQLQTVFDAPETPLSDDLSLKLALLALLGFVGPSIYVSQPSEVRRSAFTFAMGLLSSSSTTLRCDASSYLIGVYSLTSVDDVRLKHVLSDLAVRINKLRKGSFFESPGLVAILLDSHAWTPLTRITLTDAYDSAVSSGNWDAGAYVLGLGITIKSLAPLPFSVHLPKVRSWYAGASPHLTAPARVLVSIPIQYIEIIGNTDLLGERDPWLLDGVFIQSAADFETVRALPLHSLAWYTFSLRLAIVFNAGKEVVARIVEDGEKVREGGGGLIYSQEWLFLSSLFYVRHGDAEEQLVAKNIQELERYESIDFKLRISLLHATRSMRASFDQGGARWLDVLEQVDALLETLNEKGFWLLEGILSASAARYIILVAQSRLRLAVGYARASNDAFIRVEAFAVAQVIRQQFASSFSSTLSSSTPLLPSQLLVTHATPEVNITTPSLSLLDELRTASVGSEARSPSSVDSPYEVESVGTGSVSDAKVTTVDKTSDNSALPELTFMRGSLLLAGERDPSVLVVTLSKILCQFVRADFCAVALHDEVSNSLRLRGAGPYASLRAYDLDFSHPETASLAPISTLLHVSRTKKPITSISNLQKLRSDPFYEDRLPRSILVLPLSQQGRYVGVLLLSSKTVVTPPAQLPQLVEVCSCLATFAAIALESSQSTVKLESIVSERTARLQDALAAKTTFLSHMSHELRTPLFAVLGLAAVLEDSPGLDSVQREHLATIRSSGEDLQNVVSNILDWSRLEQGDLQPESIPFSLRDVIEQTLDSVATLANNKNLNLVLANTTASDPPTLIGDPFRIKQILMNLCSNAIKFTGTGGSIVVRWRTETRDSSHEFIRVSVADTGVGIPPHKMDRLFKSFSQIDNSITRSYGGSGLGLAISQSLARLMGGSCSAKSVIGTGSTFSFSFVVSKQEVADPAPPHLFPTFAVDSRSAFVLAAPGVFKDTLEEELLNFGVFPVDGSEDFERACRQLTTRQYSIILVDSRLVNIKEVEQLRRLQKKAKIFYLSPIAQLSATIDRLKIKHQETLPRPLRASTLHDAVSPYIEGETAPLRAKVKTRSEIDPEMAQKYPLSILLVDDNRVNCLVGAKILERFGYNNIQTAFDGLEAVEKAEKSKFSLILMDLQMPASSPSPLSPLLIADSSSKFFQVLDGYKANARIAASELAGHPCVVALSANTDDATMGEVQRQSFTAYLSKPLSIPALAETLVMVHTIQAERKKAAAENAGDDA